MKAFKDKQFLRDFFRVSFPVMLHAFISFIVSFIDNIMVGSISNAAISGVYASNQATFMFICSSLGLISGAGIFIQQFFGAKDDEHIRQCFRYKLVASFFYLLIIIPLYYLIGEKIIYFYCHSDVNSSLILEEGKSYLYLIVLSYIPFLFASCYSTSLREIGHANVSMIAGLVAFIINVIFNSLFIFVFHLGVKGAAYATIIARCTELLVVAIISHKKKFSFCAGAFKNFIIEKDLVKRVTKKTIFLFLNEVFWVTGMIMISLAYSQRDNVLSALSVVSTMSDVFGIVFQGLSIGIGVLVGGYLGASEFDKAKDYASKIYVLGTCIALCATIILCALSPVIPLLFKEIDAEQKILASKLIRIYGIFIPFYCFCTMNYVILKTGGKTILTFLLDSVLQWILYIPLAWILSSFTSLSLFYIYIAVQSADVVKTVIGFILVKRGTWIQNITFINCKSKFNLDNTKR
ncbi:MAG: MATE family efflux transporter [Bacilli bacterium]